MRQFSEAESATVRENLLGNLLLFLFGCGVLAFFVTVDRVDWLKIRPASASSAAMAQAASASAAADPRLVPKERPEAR
ncbi:hypothetical protein HT136_16725 [Novosphingobium profundi]|uniref:hypothetical protein n=1 Tax=Novosphingobium profundi TaxID=1774954 RepID=UPI001BD917C7|nr:hypothetical protein [Novosphingobium profundi]MBT0670011.1 hypothetical protein [Novosphingobium profundi]